ncbi:cation transporter [Halioxenophilus sp. WMMB6]|uniref:cation transporter n=1 Tax=Halioxenophilus sp. WMMB6 TaxID=3073815 RepID=UPI00295E6FC5|nr:cation transporter [Halioxenophilus sp. WMMB6]
MKKEEHRPGVNEVNLVVRHLKLESSPDAKIAEAMTEVDTLYGLDALSFDERSQVLNLTYDASRLGLDGIEEVLAKYGVEISHDWWTHLKEGFYKFIDENVQENAKQPPWDCHQRYQQNKHK